MKASEVSGILYRARRLKFQLEAGDRSMAARICPQAALAITRHRHGSAGRRFAETVQRATGGRVDERALAMAIRAQLLREEPNVIR